MELPNLDRSELEKLLAEAKNNSDVAEREDNLSLAAANRIEYWCSQEDSIRAQLKWLDAFERYLLEWHNHWHGLMRPASRSMYINASTRNGRDGEN